MADEHSTAASAASPGLALPTHVKRASSSKARTPVSPAQPSPFGSYPASSVPMNVGKKATITKAAAATTTAAIGIKRGSSGKAKVAGSPLKEQMSVDEDEDEEVETPSKVCKHFKACIYAFITDFPYRSPRPPASSPRKSASLTNTSPEHARTRLRSLNHSRVSAAAFLTGVSLGWLETLRWIARGSGLRSCVSSSWRFFLEIGGCCFGGREP